MTASKYLKTRHYCWRNHTLQTQDLEVVLKLIQKPSPWELTLLLQDGHIQAANGRKISIISPTQLKSLQNTRTGLARYLQWRNDHAYILGVTDSHLIGPKVGFSRNEFTPGTVNLANCPCLKRSQSLYKNFTVIFLNQYNFQLYSKCSPLFPRVNCGSQPLTKMLHLKQKTITEIGSQNAKDIDHGCPTTIETTTLHHTPSTQGS